MLVSSTLTGCGKLLIDPVCKKHERIEITDAQRKALSPQGAKQISDYNAMYDIKCKASSVCLWSTQIRLSEADRTALTPAVVRQINRLNGNFSQDCRRSTLRTSLIKNKEISSTIDGLGIRV